MNWVDFVLIAALLTAIIVGYKKGLVRELSAFVLFFAALILTVSSLDKFAVWTNDKFGGSPLVAAFISFILLLGLSYGLFKLLGWIFYKVASIKSNGRPDQIGGAIVGLIRGWVTVGTVTVLLFMLPMPDRFYNDFDTSFFGHAIAKTVPVVYESTRMVKPEAPTFMEKMESTLITSPTKGKNSSKHQKNLDSSREQVYRVMYQMDRFFNTQSEI